METFCVNKNLICAISILYKMDPGTQNKVFIYYWNIQPVCGMVPHIVSCWLLIHVTS